MQVYVPQHDTTPVSARQMRLLVPGEWYAMRLPEKDGWSLNNWGVFHHGYVGRLQQSDAESLTLTDVTRCTYFDSTSALRHMPVLGDNFYGTLSCKNEPGTVTLPRSKGMWFERISAERADLFRRYEENLKSPIVELPAFDEANSQTAQHDISIFFLMPNAEFLLPNPKVEEVRSQRWLEVREMKPGRWYRVSLPREMRDNSYEEPVHIGFVDHVDEDSVQMTNVTSGSVSANGHIRIDAPSEITLRFPQIDRATELTEESVEAQVASFRYAN